jgi:membrane associated rhomboid family serine protease
VSQPPYPPQPPQPDAQQQAALPTCWWHPERQTGLRCTRCERPACPECLREASVGYQCIDCVQAARQEHRAQRARYRKQGFGARTVAGARASSTAIVTPVLIAINVLIFVITAAQARDPMRNRDSALFDWWGLWTPITASGEWWRLFTSGFLHFGVMHLAVNMLALWILGRELELLLGKLRYLGVYTVALLGGGVVVFAFGGTDTMTAGASGAIYGLMGGVAVAVVRMRLNPGPVLGLIVLNLVISVTIPGISLLGHLGGLVFGALATVAMVYAPQRGRAGWQGGVLVVLLVAAIGLVLYRDAQLGEFF